MDFPPDMCYSVKTKLWLSCGMPTPTTSSLIVGQTTSPSEAAVVGAFNCVLILTSVIPYSCILWILSFNKEYASDSYRIIFHLGVADCIQLIVQFPPSLWHALRGENFHIVGNKVFGSLLNAGWVSYVMLTLLLALNRLFTIMGGATAEDLFIGRYLGTFISLCWIWGLVFFAAYLTPHLEMSYNPSSLTWVYTGTDSLHQIVRKTAIYSVLTEITLTALAYIIICCYLCYGSHCDSKSLVQQSRRAGRTRQRELRILLQAILIAGFAVLLLAYWNYYWVLFSNTRWVLYTANCLWIINGCVNPFVYLALNSSIRRKVCGLVVRSPNSSSSPKISTTVTNDDRRTSNQV